VFLIAQSIRCERGNYRLFERRENYYWHDVRIAGLVLWEQHIGGTKVAEIRTIVTNAGMW
jgi:hypothetical protein